MKRRNLIVVLVTSAFVAITAASELNSYQGNQLKAEVLTKKTTIDQFEKVRIGNHTFTSLDVETSKNFLSDELIGNDSTWETAVANSTAWKTTGGFTTKEQSKIVSKLASTANIPALESVANEAIGDVTERWWLNDAVGKYGTPKGYVDTDRKVNNGYTRTGATVTDGACSIGDVNEAGGLPTKAQTVTTELVQSGLMFRALSNNGNGAGIFMHTVYDNSTCEGDPLVSVNVPAGYTDSSCTIRVDRDDDSKRSVLMKNQEEWAEQNGVGMLYTAEKLNTTYVGGGTLIQTMGGPKILTSCTRVPYTTGTELKPSPFYAKVNSYHASGGSANPSNAFQGSIGYGSQSCPGGSVVAQNAAVRPMLELNMTTVYSALTNVTSVTETLGAYPEAGIGPYTLQMSDAGLKVGLDSTNKNVSGNTLQYPANDVENGKVVIPYDLGGSTYDANSTSYITVMKNGKYAKLGSATQNGKGSVTVDLNEFITKTDGEILPQEVTISLYQEEVTPDGYTNYISNEVPITIQILEAQLAQSPELSITNSASLTYGDGENKLQVVTVGDEVNGGTITYEITSGTEFASVDEAGLISIIKPGVFMIEATKAGIGDYRDSVVSKEITINQKIQSDLAISNEDFLIDSEPNFTVIVTGKPDSLTNDLTYAITAGEDNASIEGNVITPIKVGSITISVTSVGDVYWADKTITKEIAITQLPDQSPALSITNAASIVYDKTNTTFDIQVAGGEGEGGLTYELTAGDEFASIADDVVTIIKPGTFTIKVTKDGNEIYKDSIATKEFTVAQATQSDFKITNGDFTMKSDAMSFKLTSSGVPEDLSESITYSLVEGEEFASISGDTITAIKEGTIKVSATSTGNTFYKDCIVEKTIAINDLPEQSTALAISNAASLAYDEMSKSFVISTTGGQGNGKLTYSVVSGEDVAAIDEDGTVTIAKVGLFEVEVIKAGDAIYKDSVAKKVITITKGEQSDFIITNSNFLITSGPDFAITTTGRPEEVTGALSYRLSSGEGSIASINGDRITPIKVGNIEIEATSPASSNYNEKIVKKTIAISDLPLQNPEITITNTNVVWGDNNNLMSISTSGGQGSGAITYEITQGKDSVASIKGDKITILKTGKFTILAKKSGGSVYSDSEATKEIVVAKKAITIKPKKITKKVDQAWGSVVSNGYDVTPALVSGDVLQGTPIYAYGTGVNDQSPAGSYSTVLSGLSNDNYTITYEEGSLLVEKDSISSGDALAFYRIKSGTLGLNGWYTSDVVFESLKKNGYDLLSNTNVFTSSEVSITSQGIQDINLSFKNTNGSITEPIVVPLKIDKEKPVMNEIVLKEKNTGVLAQFVNALSFGNWFQKEIVVELSATDNLGKKCTYQYQEEVNGVLSAVKTTSDDLSYGNGSNVILHVKAIDEAGNVSNQAVVSPQIQVDLDAPKVTGVVNNETYYLPKFVVISDENSGINEEFTYYKATEKKELHEQSLFKGTGTILLYVQDNASNVTEVTFTMKGLPAMDSIKKDDASREIIADVQKEYDEIKDKLDKDEQKVIEDWLAGAKEQAKKQVEQIKEPDSGIIVGGSEGVVFDEDITLIVEIITSEIQMEEIDLGEVSGLEVNDEIKEAFDIYLKKGTERVQPTGMVRVKIPYTDLMKTYENLRVVYIDNDRNVSIYPHTLEDAYIVFETDHFSHYAVTGKIKKTNEDSNGDGKADVNVDTDGDGKPDINIDTDGDGVPDVNIDTDLDGKPDFNVDVDNDGEPDINIGNPQNPWNPTVCGTVNKVEYCSDGISKPYLNIDTDKDGKPDINIDFDKDKLPDLNIDDDLNYIPELDIDTDGDGKPDVNVDLNQDGKADKFIKEITSWKPNSNYSYNGFQYDSDSSLAYDPIVDGPNDPSFEGGGSSDDDNNDDDNNGNNNNGNGNNNNNNVSNGSNNSDNGSDKDSTTTVKGAYTGDERNWNQWWVLMITSTVLMAGSYLVRKRFTRK